eukprot:scaffold189370_cov31-Tisochrysis_lutea.AAC.1
MPFKRFVEVGRVCLVTYGPYEGKLCVILNVIDQSHVLVDGTPAGDAGTPRMGISLKRVMLTDLKVPIKLNATAKCAACAPHPRSPRSRCALMPVGYLCAAGVQRISASAGRWMCAVGCLSLDCVPFLCANLFVFMTRFQASLIACRSRPCCAGNSRWRGMKRALWQHGRRAAGQRKGSVTRFVKCSPISNASRLCLRARSVLTLVLRKCEG